MDNNNDENAQGVSPTRQRKRASFFADLLDDVDDSQESLSQTIESHREITVLSQRRLFASDEEDLDEGFGTILFSQEHAQAQNTFTCDVEMLDVNGDQDLNLAKNLDSDDNSNLPGCSSGVFNSSAHVQLQIQSTIQRKKEQFFEPPLAGSFLLGRTSKGKELYFPRHYRKFAVATNAIIVGERLLSGNIHILIRELNSRQKNANNDRTTATLQSVHDILSKVGAPESQLWVDKYRPTSYLDLVGDETTSREVLGWLKEWDECVFKRKFRKLGGDQRKLGCFQDGKVPIDLYHRPQQKILLMSGPPGLGKTTLAYVTARQSGYRVVEINASDVRTGTAVKGRLEAALHMRTISRGQTEQVPNILVLDEIDGISTVGGEQSFIKLLIDIANSADNDKKSKSRSGKERNAKEKSNMHLRRPIICICNDLYTPSLRSLRAVAKICVLRKPTTMNLIKRLAEICKLEGLTTDSRTLTHLVTVTDGDMRACLNTLQFIRHKTHILTLDVLSNLNIGNKDTSKSLFTIWEELFQSQSEKKIRHSHHGGTKQYVNRLVQLMTTYGEYDRIMQGCFENYLGLRSCNQTLQRITELFEHITVYDRISQRTFGGSGNSENLEGYLPYLLSNFHRFLAVHARPQLEYPRSDYEAFIAQRDRQHTLQSLCGNIIPSVQRYLSIDILVHDTLPYYMRIISPQIKTVTQVRDKKAVSEVVNALANYQIRLIQEKQLDGQYKYRMEPPIDVLIPLSLTGSSSSITCKTVLPSNIAVRQLIAHELNMMHLRQSKSDVVVIPRHVSLISKKRKPEQEVEEVVVVKDEHKTGIDFFGRQVNLDVHQLGNIILS